MVILMKERLSMPSRALLVALAAFAARALSQQSTAADRAARLLHTVVRTPNGNDYGKDLLRQHYAIHPHAH